MLDVFASEAHFADHLRPVLDALTIPWTLYGPGETSRAVKGPGPALVAGFGDLQIAENLGRRIAIMEHGAGQSYGGHPGTPSSWHPSYAGGIRRTAELFLHPGPHPASRDRERYPDARIEVVGCPKLDTLPHRIGTPDDTVAVSFHWDCQILAETRTAFVEYREQVSLLAKQRHVLGHAHPRIFGRVKEWYRQVGIEPVESLTEVMERADLYACDNSSSIFEFASTGRPVLLLNPSFYRRDVNHGLRFWEASTVGINVDKATDLRTAVSDALRDTEAQQREREHALGLVYAYRGGAGPRAARVVEDWACG